MSGPTQENRPIELISPLGKDKLLLISADINESISELFRIDLDVLSEDPNIKFEDIIGKNVSVKLVLPDSATRFFNGFVGSFREEGLKDGLAHYSALIYPWLWFLTHTHDCRIFQNKTVPDIIKQIFDDLDFSDAEFKLTSDYRELEYCVQYRETDFNFVSRLMEQEGIFYYFKHEEDRHILILSDSNSSHEAYEGFETIPFSKIDASGTPGKSSIMQESVRDLVVEKHLQSGIYVQRDFDFKVPKKDLTTLNAIDRKHDRSDYEVYDYPGLYKETTDGDVYAKTRMEEIHTQYETIFCRSDARGVSSGYFFDLTGHNKDTYNKRYLITSATHHLSTTGFQSGVAIEGMGYSAEFKAIDFKHQFRPRRVTAKPVVEGLQTAMVTGRPEDEIYTDEYGRVKVQFHWDREGRYDQNSSCWIRVAQIWAGKKWGAMYIPRVGQEVIVDFLEGDPDQPVITGRVYNGKSMPPYDLPNEKTKSTIKSRSSKGGEGFNELRFEDKKGKEQVFIHAQRNLDIRVKSNRYETIGYNRDLVVGNNKKEHIKNDRHELIDNHHKEEIGGNQNVTIAGKRKTMVSGKQSLTVGGDHSEEVGGSHSEKVGSDFSLNAGNNIVLDAGSNITLKVGQSYIAIESGGISISTPGDIRIEAANLNIKTTMATNIEATTNFTAKGLTAQLQGSTLTEVIGALVKIN